MTHKHHDKIDQQSPEERYNKKKNNNKKLSFLPNIKLCVLKMNRMFSGCFFHNKLGVHIGQWRYEAAARCQRANKNAAAAHKPRKTDQQNASEKSFVDTKVLLRTIGIDAVK